MVKSLKRKISIPLTSTKKSNLSNDYSKIYQTKRENFVKSPLDFKFNKSRVKILNDCNSIKEGDSTILYWMHRDQRVQDNWAMIFAQKLALKYKLPLQVCFCIDKPYMNFSYRHYNFMIRGLEEVNSQLTELNIQFSVFLGNPIEYFKKFFKQNNISAFICDYFSLNPFKTWIEDLKNVVPSDVSYCIVDAHNIIPVWVTSDKREYAAKTIRPKIHKHLMDFLTEFPPVIVHSYGKCVNKFEKDKYFKYVGNEDVEALKWANPGYKEGLMRLEDFVENRLCVFADTRNDATHEVTSNLSPWFRFGHLSTQRAVLRVMDFNDKYKKHVEIFVEEGVVRRELADNYCYYTEVPDSPDSAPDWGKKTLEKHMKDKRPYVYDLKILEKSGTHDPIWNAAQNQLIVKGKMSGYLRMYWGKKILEWSSTPEIAFKNLLFLNDKYSIDGNDCNGVVGCMWSVYGLHDRPWGERPIFGYIRYMSEVGCNRHFDVNGYIEKYGDIKNIKI